MDKNNKLFQIVKREIEVHYNNEREKLMAELVVDQHKHREEEFNIGDHIRNFPHFCEVIREIKRTPQHIVKKILNKDNKEQRMQILR